MHAKTYPVPESIKGNTLLTNEQYMEMYQHSVTDPEGFWGQHADDLAWYKKPIVIILHTEMGNGVNFMMGTHKWHGSAPNDKQLADALSQNEETLGDY